jgi:hypothetical protein
MFSSWCKYGRKYGPYALLSLNIRTFRAPSFPKTVFISNGFHTFREEGRARKRKDEQGRGRKSKEEEGRGRKSKEEQGRGDQAQEEERRG